MSNMSYCRFRNTLYDFNDCISNLEDKDITIEEHEARYRLLKGCLDIVKTYHLEEELDSWKEYKEPEYDD